MQKIDWFGYPFTVFMVLVVVSLLFYFGMMSTKDKTIMIAESKDCEWLGFVDYEPFLQHKPQVKNCSFGVYMDEVRKLNRTGVYCFFDESYDFMVKCLY